MKKSRFRWIPGLLLAPAIVFLSARFKALAPAKWYPVLVSAVFLAAFAASFFKPPVMIFRFALLMDKTIRGSLKEKRVEAYCRRVTVIWCAFFALNGGAAALTVLSGSDKLWLLYNGCLSYILMGILFLGELMVRQTVNQHMPKEIPFSRFTPEARPMDTILCFDGAFSGGKYKTWRDLFTDTALIRKALAAAPQGKWILHAEDYWHFLTAFIALFQCKKQVLLTANTTAGNIAEIVASAQAGADGGGVGILADIPLDGALQIEEILAAGLEKEAGEVEHVPFDPVQSVFVIYTSGSTGKPKAIPHRIIEFETNIGFPRSWVEAWMARKNIVTVDQHHIYGLIFSVVLPFTLGIPFRRRRVESPEELLALTDTPYMLITTPAFLKRAVDSGVTFPMKDPWIIASGGFLTEETAAQVEKRLGFWPIDIYGSTEGSGIAWRQSKNGPQWAPFGAIKVSANPEGCLMIHLPIPNVPPIPTGDLVEIREDGSFILLGRADSIVKIEEKRISLPEVEGRLMESGLAAEVAVIPMEDRRQYLAAAIVLNGAGKARFAGQDKAAINRFWTEHLLKFFEPVVVPKKWRYVEKIPQNIQGKTLRADVAALFTEASAGG